MFKQNITLSLPKNLLKRIKLIAVNNDLSISRFLREALENKINQETGYNRAKLRQLKLLKMNFDLGTKGQISIKRDELHDRR